MKFGTDPAWHFEGEPLVELPGKPVIGFVYCITNITNGMRYIGKRNFYSTRTIKGKKTTTESDWRDYWGSNPRLHADVAKLGTLHFYRTIITLCTSKSQMSYQEAQIQFKLGVLTGDNFYNDCIIVKINRRQIGKPSWNTNI